MKQARTKQELTRGSEAFYGLSSYKAEYDMQEGREI